MRRIRDVVVACLLMVSVPVGCASRSTTTTTEERVRYPADGTGQPSDTVVGRRTTTKTVTGPRPAPRGVLSTAVHVVGELLALPFRLIGGLIRWLF